MSAAALLAELDGAGVRLSLHGDNLRYQTRPGVSITPYVDRITAHKPALLQELLQQRIVEAVAVDPEHFDRAAYDDLWRRWHALNVTEERTPCHCLSLQSESEMPRSSWSTPTEGISTSLQRCAGNPHERVCPLQVL